jgi:outer membrane cobalamin receptor
MKYFITTLLIFFLFAFVARAQHAAVADTTPFYRMSLEQLMNLDVTVASQLPMTNRESPGIISVITAEEISRSGAQDLMQVLQMIPGIDFGVDVDGVVGIGIRGNWAHEGKVLVLWDGMEMNEDLYSTVPFGNHFPVDRIRKIEIIRGPGSAIYGGSAEYAVINVVTENDKDFNGIHAMAAQSGTSKGLIGQETSVAVGRNIGAVHLNLSGGFSENIRSDQPYTDYLGNSYDMSDQSELESLRYRADLYYKGLSFTGMYNKYSVEQRDGYDAIYRRPYETEFTMGNLVLKYDIQSKRGFTVTPGISLKYQKPWSYTKDVVDDDFETFNTTVNKKTYYINTTCNPFKDIHVVAGIQYYNLMSYEHIDSVYFFNGSRKFAMDNYSAYLQSVVKLKPGSLIFGNRFEYNPYYGASYTPRGGITRVRDAYHVKALYSCAFRTPSVENINTSPGIEPERSTTFEIEGGIRITKFSYLTANVFNQTTWNPIIYIYDQNAQDIYKNEACSGSYGFELDYKWKTAFLYTDINYSFYHPNNKYQPCVYQVPGKENLTFAFAAHMVNLNANLPVNRRLNVNTSVSYYSDRYSYSKNVLGISTITNYTPTFYSGLAVSYDDLFIKGLGCKVSCTNLFDEQVIYIQPYKGNHEPLPGPGRAMQVKLAYRF